MSGNWIQKSLAEDESWAEHETCDCCSPMQQASVALLDDYFEKAKKKPFHGYNPKPSKLKPGSKRAKRRKSFCARMGGSKGPTSKDGKLTPKGAALKRWNC